MAKIFKEVEKLLGKSGEVDVGDAVKGGGEKQVVGLYFSAHWCPPCRYSVQSLAHLFFLLLLLLLFFY